MLVGSLAVGGLALLFVAPIAGSVALGVPSAGLFTAAIGMLALLLPKVWIRGVIRDDAVVLRGVHPTFAAATAVITEAGPAAPN